MSLTIVQVDAFTNRPFAGNPAAVCVLSVPRDERWMQDVAREMNLSETAFLHPADDGYARLRLRIALLRAAGWCSRGPGHRIGALRARAVLERAPQQDRDDGLPGVAARWRGARTLEWRARDARGPGRDRVAGRARGHLTGSRWGRGSECVA